MYVSVKVIPVETISGIGVGEERINRRAVEGVNSSMIYLIHCKNFCKCYNVLLPSTTIKKNVQYVPE
jgi:hypothetical protein